ncbi:hypothetical protein K1719_012086 [Acacia pycnantha]|nr:hypothetical protein K1719_012086 [Acacia pycnantha]
MKKRQTASTSKVPFRHGEGERQFPNLLSTNNVATSSAVNRNSNRPISIFCSGNTSLENNIPTPQPEVQTPLSRLDMHSALTDITNTHSNGELIQCNISGLTFEHNINLTPSGIPKSYSVNQKKRGKRRSEQISQVAAELCSRFNESEEGNIFNVTQDTGANFSQSLKFSYLDEGDAVYGCKFCGAQMWLSEGLKRVRKSEPPQFSMCCGNGKILLLLLKPSPSNLVDLFFNKESAYSKNFMKNVRSYNNMFCFTSMGGRIDHSINSNGGGPYSFILCGQNHHLIGSLLPPEGNTPVYSQLYIYDTDNEVSNRISAVSRHGSAEELNPNIVKMIKDCLDENNSIVRQYRSAADIIKQNVFPDRDIIVRKQSGDLQRIDELHMAYLPLQYPLLFPYGNDGYNSSIEHAAETLSKTKKKKKLTPREYLAFRLMRRRSERYMIQNYQDAMAICAWAGYPDIFITFTCNPMWPEITRHCDECGLKACDKPKVLSRIFNVKLNKLMRVLKDEKIFGTVKAEVYTIEFQKRGLPHAHIILWLTKVEKVMTPFDVDKLISAEIPR